MTQASLLAEKRAVIFGAGGAVGTAVAKELAAQGATLFLSGRRLATVEPVAADIRAAGGTAQAAEVDATNEPVVSAYLDGVAREAGRIDVLVNLMGHPPQAYGNGTGALELPLEQFALPLTTLVASQFITARAGARQMVERRSGVILFVTAVPARGLPGTTAIGSAFGAVESLLRCLAMELGPHGVRVVGIRSGAMVDSSTIQMSMERVARQASISKEQAVAMLEQRTLLRRLPTVADTARLAAFLASDGARALTGAIVNASSGGILD